MATILPLVTSWGPSLPAVLNATDTIERDQLPLCSGGEPVLTAGQQRRESWHGLVAGFFSCPAQPAENLAVLGVGELAVPAETTRIHQEAALPLQSMDLRMITQYPAQLARPAPARTTDKERPAHLSNVTAQPAGLQSDLPAPATAALACPHGRLRPWRLGCGYMRAAAGSRCLCCCTALGRPA